MQRLHAVAEAALAGRLEPGRLTALSAEAAMAELRTIPGMGPVYAGLVYLRATGISDALISDEPRLISYLRHHYRLPQLPDLEAISGIAEPWRPFRTWAGVLFRVAGDREGLTVEQPPQRARARAGYERRRPASSR